MRTLSLSISTIISAAATVGLIAACQSDATAPPIRPDPPVGLSVDPRLATIDGGNTLRLTATMRHTDGSSSTPPGVSWTSADETIATVAADGVVQGRKAGRVQIVASWHASRGSSLVTVLDPTAKQPPLRCIEPSRVATGTGIPENPRCR